MLDTNAMEGGIVNIAFIGRLADEQLADSAPMRSTFWIMELDDEKLSGEPRLLLAYPQFIFLDFFQRRDGREGLIRWPHASISMMEKIAPVCRINRVSKIVPSGTKPGTQRVCTDSPQLQINQGFVKQQPGASRSHSHTPHTEFQIPRFHP